MAVTKTAPKIKAEILVNNVALEEYEDDEEQTSVSTVMKYIEARSGAEFAISYRFDEKPSHHVMIRFLLDGKFATGKLALLEDFRGSPLVQTSHGVRSNEGGKWQVSKYAFSELTTSTFVK